MAGAPIASVARLKELGLNPAQYGSCSEPLQKSIRNKGRTWINRGCPQWDNCRWREGGEHQLAMTEEERKKSGCSEDADAAPRPRHVITKFIKPSSSGLGDRIINSYCPCFRFIGGIGQRDGRNNEIAEVVGGEGESVLLKTNTRVTNPDGTIYFKPGMKDVTVPRFPDPTEVDELFEDVYAARSRQDRKARTTDAERERRLSGAIEREEGLTITDVDPRSV